MPSERVEFDTHATRDYEQSLSEVRAIDYAITPGRGVGQERALGMTHPSERMCEPPIGRADWDHPPGRHSLRR